MKILITGARGMVGRNLVDLLATQNYQLLTPTSSELNLLDEQRVREYLKDQRPELVVHCAGKVGGIQANIKDPLGFFTQNFEMGSHLVKASFDFGIQRFLNLGSSCMYPKDFSREIKESDLMTGLLEPTNEGYALAKIAVAKMCEYISQMQQGFYYKTLIPCNIYGKYDHFSPERSHMIPAVIRKVHQAKKQGSKSVEIWGDGEACREFMYAEDLAQYIFLCMEKIQEIPQYLNIGLGRDYTINEYYQEIAAVVGYQGNFHHNLDKPVGMKRKIVDISNLKKLFSYNPHSLKDGIEKTYDYFLTSENTNE